mmetsp:Transcript_21113/g.37704  ORF Transcript_21113/g.37704 Transcript_21113/m.37704 type:complete len:241 (-) Transcript_21113:1024-1746(-)
MEALAREAYFRLLKAVGVMGKLYEFKALGILKVVRGHLNLSKDDHDELLSLVEQDPIVRAAISRPGAAALATPPTVAPEPIIAAPHSSKNVNRPTSAPLARTAAVVSKAGSTSAAAVVPAPVHTTPVSAPGVARSSGSGSIGASGSGSGSGTGNISPPSTPLPGAAALLSNPSVWNKAKKAELQGALASCDTRETELIRTLLDMVDDSETIDEVSKLFEEAQQLAAREMEILSQWKIKTN